MRKLHLLRLFIFQEVESLRKQVHQQEEYIQELEARLNEETPTSPQIITNGVSQTTDSEVSVKKYFNSFISFLRIILSIIFPIMLLINILNKTKVVHGNVTQCSIMFSVLKCNSKIIFELLHIIEKSWDLF